MLIGEQPVVLSGFPAGGCTYPASQCLYEVRNEFLNLSDFFHILFLQSLLWSSRQLVIQRQIFLVHSIIRQYFRNIIIQFQNLFPFIWRITHYAHISRIPECENVEKDSLGANSNVLMNPSSTIGNSISLYLQTSKWESMAFLIMSI